MVGRDMGKVLDSAGIEVPETALLAPVDYEMEVRRRGGSGSGKEAGRPC